MDSVTGRVKDREDAVLNSIITFKDYEITMLMELVDKEMATLRRGNLQDSQEKVQLSTLKAKLAEFKKYTL